MMIVTPYMRQPARVWDGTASLALGRLSELGATRQMVIILQEPLAEDCLAGGFA